MTKESLNNIGVVCNDHAPKAGKYSGQDPKIFIGKFIKLGFPFSLGTEHMWVRVDKLGTDTQLEGVLENDPIYDVGYDYGDGVGFDVSEIEDIDEEIHAG